MMRPGAAGGRLSSVIGETFGVRQSVWGSAAGNKAGIAVVVAAVLLCAARPAAANGHGPVFGLSTPTNNEGGWSLDTSFMGSGTGASNASMFRSMLAYGVTPDLQLSLSAPALMTTPAGMPFARGTAMMPTDGDYEGLVAYRFQRSDFAPGARYESTAYFGLELPGPQQAFRLPAAKSSSLIEPRLNWVPGFYGALASGLASRSDYFWYGAGFQYFAPNGGDQRPWLLFYSLVYGYRPEFLRWDYPSWDGRFFLELTGERFNQLQLNGVGLPGTGGSDLFFGPSTLWLYKNYGIETGIQFPLYENVGFRYGRTLYRWVIDASYFF
ncbi:MAG: hypothetical protein M1336_07010 [Deltaproteobacteria bacterium]|jgi:hypothetical protein|nr:hypothetical protein [Deltaproteobacteria bacterium]